MTLIQLLDRYDACGEARKWVATQPDDRTAWETCPRTDWMLWLGGRLLPCKEVVAATCDCAETALELVEEGEAQMAIMLYLHITREWVAGRADIDDVRAFAFGPSPWGTVWGAVWTAVWDAAWVAAWVVACAFSEDATAAVNSTFENHNPKMAEILRERWSYSHMAKAMETAP